jgi:hypothetical protein
MTSKKIKLLVLVGLVLALSMGLISNQDSSEGSVMMPAVKNASVSPPEGNYTDSFEYAVDVLFYEVAEIELQFYHPTKREWTTYETREYTGNRSWETLRWNWIPADQVWEGENVSYRFKWKSTNLLYGQGPYIKKPIAWEFRNAIVRPSSGYYNDEFTYSVDVKLNKEEEISLEVSNISSYMWEVRGEKQYTNTGNWQEMKWDNITDIASADSEGVASYRFFFIEAGERYESPQIYYGPILKPILKERYKNATVTPPSGYYNTSFIYSVEINTSEDVLLTVYDISIDEWIEKGIGNKTGDRVEWKNIQFNEDCEGVARYKFVAGIDESAIFDGPRLELYPTPSPTPTPTPTTSTPTTSTPTPTPTPTPYYSSHHGGGGGGGGSSFKPYMLYENANVDPDSVSIGVSERKTFTYSVEVDKDTPVILEVYNLASMIWEEKGLGEKSKLEDVKWKLEWDVNLTLDKNWAGNGKYRFYPEDREKYASQVFYGPEIISSSLSAWKEEIGFSDKVLKTPNITCTLTPEKGMWFKKFSYTAEINHPDRANMTVALYVYKPGSEDYKIVPWLGYRYNPIIAPSDYDTSNNATVTWTVEKKEIFDEEDGEKNSKFYIWYWDGYNENRVDFYGPELSINHEPEFVKMFKPKPENGSTQCVYEYNFEINDPDNDTVEGSLTVIDPVGEEHAIKGIYKDGNLTFKVEPGDIFTSAKLERYTKSSGKPVFTSQYRLEYWDEGMMVKGETKKEPKEGWFTGPNVTAVTVTHTKPIVKSSKGTYADEFEYRLEFYSSKQNTITLNITIYDPSNRSNPWSPKGVKDLKVAADAEEPVSWTIKPEVFGPEDAGKTARYTIAWTDSYGNEGILNGSGPYIERAVPLLSWNLPLVPVASMVLVPLGVIGISLLSVLSGVPVSSLLKSVLDRLRKRAKGTKEKKEEAED